MRVLIINAYDVDTAAGIEAYKTFRELVIKTLHKCKVLDNEYIERRLDDLAEYVLDWEHDNLDRKSQVLASNFDKLDFIFLAGDMRILPWEPVATHVVTIIHMCKQTKKPFFGGGFGAFCGVYSLATKGSRFHILNGPHGDEIEHLAAFPRYSIGNGAYPSGWYDNETGDLYTYSPNSKSWNPVCNIGIYRCASYGSPASNRHAVKKYAREDHLLSYHQKVEAVGGEEDVAHIRNPFLQHVTVRNLEAQNFTVKPIPMWYFNTDGALPSGEGLYVIADGTKGPILMAKDSMLLFGAKIDRSSCLRNVRTILTGFVESQIAQTVSARNDSFGSSLSIFLFDRGGATVGTYDSVRHRQKMTAALATKPVKTTAVPFGPVKVDPPVIGMFFQKPEIDLCHTHAVAAKLRRDSAAGMGRTVTIQNPLSARRGRLELLTARSGYNSNGSMTDVINTAVALSSSVNPTELADNLPESAREMFTGRVMKDNSISTRRHHIATRGQHNEVVYPAEHVRRPQSSSSSTAALDNPSAVEGGSVFDSEEFGGSLHSSRKSSMVEGEEDDDHDHFDDADDDEEEEDILSRCFTIVPFMGRRRSSPVTEAVHRKQSVLVHNAVRDLKAKFQSAAALNYDFEANFPNPDTPPKEMPSHRTHRKHHLSDSKNEFTGRGPRVPAISDWHKAIAEAEVANINHTLHQHKPVNNQSARVGSSSSSNRRTPTSVPLRPPSLGAGPDCDTHFNRYVVQTARSARTASSINTAMAELHMHVRHPQVRVSRMVRRDSEDEGSRFLGDFADGFDQSSSLYSTSQFSSALLPPKVVVLPTPKSGPYNNYKTLSRTRQQAVWNQRHGQYQGQYREEFVPEAVRPVKEYVKAKEKFLAGPFKTAFGQANSAMVPGKEGLIRGQGPFPEAPLPGIPRGTTAVDWTFMKHSEKKSNLAGAWKS